MKLGAALTVALGIIVFAQGYCAHESGGTISPTKHGPMSGTQAMVIGRLETIVNAVRG
jgi:hypothetical protein